MDDFIFVLNFLGTLAFAASGAMIGLKKNMDIFGVCILGLTTATGGGVIRDLILGVTPPLAFQNPTSAIIALMTSAVFFVGQVRQLLMHNSDWYNHLLFWMDTLGLGAFTVMGVQLALEWSQEPTFFLLAFVGVITGVGGGVLRDLMAQEMPYIFVKHIYACASLVGALLCAGMWAFGSVPAMLSGMICVVSIRFLAAHYHWNLPKAKL